MATAKKKVGKEKKVRKAETAILRQYLAAASLKAQQAPKTLLHYGNVVVWQPYKSYWRWGEKLAAEPREALSDLAGGGRKAAAGIGRGAAWGVDRVRRYGEKIPGLKTAGDKVLGGIRAVPARLRLVGSEDMNRLNQAVDSLTRKVDALVGKASG